MRLILVRHGETDLHVAGFMQGNNGTALNLSLNETGHLTFVNPTGSVDHDAGA